MGGKAQEEIPCWEILTKKITPIGNFAKSIYSQILNPTSGDNQERPDMLFGDLGLEHFLVDIIIHGKKFQSFSRPLSNAHSIKLNKYLECPHLLDEEETLNSEREWIGQVINTILKGVNNYTPQKFFQTFKTVYDNHLKNCKEYRCKCQRLGFLIEIPYPLFLGQKQKGYLIDGNRYQRLRVPPLPKSFLHYIKNHHDDLDLVIFLWKPIFPSSDLKDYNAVYIDTQNVLKVLYNVHEHYIQSKWHTKN